jgi:hypothetical protein
MIPPLVLAIGLLQSFASVSSAQVSGSSMTAPLTGCQRHRARIASIVSRLSAVKKYRRAKFRAVIWAIALGIVLSDKVDSSRADGDVRQRRVRVTAVLNSNHASHNAITN